MFRIADSGIYDSPMEYEGECQSDHDDTPCPLSPTGEAACEFLDELMGVEYAGVFYWTCPCCGSEQQRKIYMGDEDW